MSSLQESRVVFRHAGDRSALVTYRTDLPTALPIPESASFESICELQRSTREAPLTCSSTGLGPASDALGPALALPHVFATVAFMDYIRQTWDAAGLSERLLQRPPANEQSPCDRFSCPDLRD